MGAPVTMMKTAAETAIAGHFAAVSPSLPGAAGLRQAAIGRFEATGLPHRRIEAWHYTDLRALMRSAAPPASAPDAAVAARHVPWSPSDGLVTVAFLDGWHVGEPAATVPGVTVHRLADVLSDGSPLLSRMGTAVDLSREPLAMLNTMFMTDGAVIHVAAGVQVADPLHLAFELSGSTAAAVTPRVLLVVEDGASVTLVESHRSPDGVGHQTNTMVEMLVGAGATVDHVRLNLAGDTTQSLSTLAAEIGAHAALNTFSFTTGAALSRHEVHVRYAGDHAKASIGGVSLLAGRQHADTTLVVDHAALFGESRELFRTVIDGAAQGVFQGKIMVRQGAQKTDGQMRSDALLLSDEAGMSNKPELEIFADDVVCAHGATCGALDDDLLFYLQARGLPRAEAEGLLIQAFAGEAIETVAHEGLRETMAALTADWLGRRTAAATGEATS